MCLESVDDGTRRCMCCGWIDADKRVVDPQSRSLPAKIGTTPWPHDVCPGWAVRQSLVVEAWRAFSAAKAGVFVGAYGDPPRLLVDALLVAQTSQAQYEADSSRKKDNP